MNFEFWHIEYIFLDKLSMYMYMCIYYCYLRIRGYKIAKIATTGNDGKNCPKRPLSGFYAKDVIAIQYWVGFTWLNSCLTDSDFFA